MTTTPNPTAERIAHDAVLAKYGTVDNWVIHETCSALRAHGLLSEGAPSEEQIDPVLEYLEEMREEDRIDYVSYVSLHNFISNLTAAGVVPKEPSEPTYSPETRQWSGTCPCIRAEQIDPECEWHGRPEFRRGGRFHSDTPAPSLDREELAQREAEEYAPGDHEAQDDFLTGWRTADRNALAAQPVLDPERVKTWLQREFGSVLAHDPHNPEQFWGGSARALCEAAKRGELTC